MIRNPGGLEAVEPFTISNFKSVDFTIAAGYAPIVPLYGFLFDLYSDFMYPAGAQVRADFFPIKRLWGFLGVEASFAWNYLKTEANSADISLHALDLKANVVYKKLLPNRTMALLARAGFGFFIINQFIFDFGSVQSDPINTWITAANGGLSFQWYIRKPFYVNLGIDYVHLFSVDKPRPGFLRPYLEAGWHF
jgi:hypothetical protein